MQQAAGLHKLSYRVAYRNKRVLHVCAEAHVKRLCQHLTSWDVHPGPPALLHVLTRGADTHVACWKTLSGWKARLQAHRARPCSLLSHYMARAAFRMPDLTLLHTQSDSQGHVPV